MIDVIEDMENDTINDIMNIGNNNYFDTMDSANFIVTSRICRANKYKLSRYN